VRLGERKAAAALVVAVCSLPSESVSLALFLAIGLFWLVSVEMREMTSVGSFAFQLNRDYTARVKALVAWRACARRRRALFAFTRQVENPVWFSATPIAGNTANPA